MVEILKAMGMSAAILLPIVILTLIASIVAVNRGTAAMSGSHGGHGLHDAVPVAAEAVPVAGKKVAAAIVLDPSVGEILLFGTVLFVIAVLLLFGVSLAGHV